MAKMGKVTVEVELQMRFGGHRALLIDLDTGDWLIPTTLEPGDGARLAASVLPGWPAELIAAAYSKWIDDDPAPSEPIEADEYGLMPDGLAALLATAQVTKTEWYTLRDIWGRDWTAITNEVLSRIDTAGKYQER